LIKSLKKASIMSNLYHCRVILDC